MFGGKKTQKVDEIDTVIGPGTKFEGNIAATGIVRVDGEFSGDITTQGDILIGEQGIVNGQLSANSMIVAGLSRAKLICRGKLIIKATGKVIGDVEVGNIVIEEKAVFEGQCYMKHEESNIKKEVVNE